jgi:hypothetical protein
MSRAPGRRRVDARLLVTLPAVLLASSGAAACIVHPYWLMLRPSRYDQLSHQYAVYPVLGSVVAVSVLVVALASSPALGPGPPVAVGAASAVFGLLVGREVHEAGELFFACLALGLGAGALAAGGLIEAVRSGHGRRLLLAAWVLPYLAAWPWTTWSTLHQVVRSNARLVPGMSLWTVVGGAGLLVAWSVYSLLTDTTGRSPGPTLPRSVQSLEFGVGLAAAMASTLAIVLTMDVEAFPSAWARPVILAGSGLTVVALVAACASTGRRADLRASYLCVVTPCVLAPAALTFTVAQADRPGRGLGLGPIIVMTVVAALAAVVATRRPDRLLVAGPALAGLGAVVAWPMPSADWLMVLLSAVLVAGLAGSAVAGLVLATEGDSWTLGFAAVVSLLVGTSFIPGLVTTGLTGDLAPRADGRVTLGLTVSAFIATTAAAHLASRQASRRRVTRETEVTIP